MSVRFDPTDSRVYFTPRAQPADRQLAVPGWLHACGASRIAGDGSVSIDLSGSVVVNAVCLCCGEKVGELKWSATRKQQTVQACEYMYAAAKEQETGT